MKKLLFLSLLSLMLTQRVAAQDIHFSQYFVAPQLINPAAFGVLNSFEAGLQYKGQWNSFTNGYTSFAAFANKSFYPKKQTAYSSKSYASVGLNVIYDKAGSSQLTNFKAEIPVNVSKRLSNTGFLTAGLYVGMGQLAVRNDNLTWGNQFDGYQYNSTLSSNESGIGQTKMYLDCGAGLNYIILKEGKESTEGSLPRNVAGFSASHLNRPAYSIYGNTDERLQMRFNFYEYYHIYFKNSPISLVPSVLVQYQGKAYEVILGASVKRMFKDETDPKKSKYISLGLFYRVQDMCALNCMIALNKYSLGLNYDFNISKLTASSKSFGGLEISLKMNNPMGYVNKSAGSIREKF